MDWLRTVPSRWEVGRLKRICRFAYGDSLSEEIRRKGKVPVFGSNGPVGFHVSANTNAPCIVVGRKGSFGKVNYSCTPVFAIDTTFFIDTRYSSADIRWLYYLLGWLRLDDISRDSAVPGLNREESYRRLIPIPPRAEQTAIARFLDQSVDRIQRYVNTKQKLIKLLAEQKQAIVQQAITGQIDVRTGRSSVAFRPYPKVRDSGVRWLGSIPAHWGVRKLKSVCSKSALYGANVPATSYADEGVRFLRTTDITDDGELISGGVFVPGELIEDYILSDGDLLISRSGTIGRSFLYDSKKHCPCGYAGYLVRFVSDKSILPRYLFWFTKTQAFSEFLRVSASSSTIENVNGEKYANCHIPLPPLSEQTAIVHTLDARLSALVKKQLGAAHQVELVSEYRDRLVADVVTGNLDVRGSIRP